MHNEKLKESNSHLLRPKTDKSTKKLLGSRLEHFEKWKFARQIISENSEFSKNLKKFKKIPSDHIVITISCVSLRRHSH